MVGEMPRYSPRTPSVRSTIRSMPRMELGLGLPATVCTPALLELLAAEISILDRHDPAVWGEFRSLV